MTTVSKLSASSQDYLKAVWTLGEWSDDDVTASTVAMRVGVKLATASDAIRKLTEQGLLEHAPYGAVTLTAAGRNLAVAMVRRHRLIESFLAEVLGYRWDEVHDEAEALEHTVSDLMIDRIDEHLGHPDRDPHGDPIPQPDGSISMPDAVLLTGVEQDRRVRVERISDADPQLLQFFASNGIAYGTVIEICPSAPYSDTVEILAADQADTLPLGRFATDAVWVSDVADGDELARCGSDDS